MWTKGRAMLKKRPMKGLTPGRWPFFFFFTSGKGFHFLDEFLPEAD